MSKTLSLTSQEAKAWKLLCEDMSNASIQYDYWKDVPADLKEKYLNKVENKNINTTIIAKQNDNEEMKLKIHTKIEIPLDDVQNYVDNYTHKNKLKQYTAMNITYKYV